MAKREKVDSMKVVMEVEAGKLHDRIKKLREERGLSQNDLTFAQAQKFPAMISPTLGF